MTIRLACVDAPELKQTPWGQQFRTRLGQLQFAIRSIASGSRSVLGE